MSELSELTAQRNDVMAELAGIEAEIPEGRNTILEAIKGQRWYFFRNNKYILMDKMTGLLWANLDYFNYESKAVIGNFDEVSGLIGWDVPSRIELWYMCGNKSFPFHSGSGYYIKEKQYWRCKGGYFNLLYDNNYSDSSDNSWTCLIPCKYSYNRRPFKFHNRKHPKVMSIYYLSRR